MRERESYLWGGVGVAPVRGCSRRRTTGSGGVSQKREEARWLAERGDGGDVLLWEVVMLQVGVPVLR